MIAQATILPMQTTLAQTLLGGLSPETFMRRHWQKKPLLIRQAAPAGIPELDRTALFALAAADGVALSMESSALRKNPAGSSPSRMATGRSGGSETAA